jgi:hypothetical protein
MLRKGLMQETGIENVYKGNSDIGNLIFLKT